MSRRLIIGISGASGAPLAVAILKALRQTHTETHVILTDGGAETLRQECQMTSLADLADVLYDNRDIGAAPASGSFQTAGMLVVPCSMKTLAGIRSGYSDNLLLRAADVTLKEGRRLVLCARETPLSAVHLRNLYELSMMGVRIVPPMLTYYQNPQSVEDMTDHIVGKLLDQFGLQAPNYRRWEGML